jgi:hypothetical protein
MSTRALTPGRSSRLLGDRFSGYPIPVTVELQGTCAPRVIPYHKADFVHCLVERRPLRKVYGPALGRQKIENVALTKR